MSTIRNWLPMAWAEAANGETVFVNVRIENNYQEASTAYETWRKSRNEENK